MHISSIEISTPYLAETSHFYHLILGFERVTNHKDQVAFQVGDSVLRFIHTERGKPRYHFAFLIPDNKIDEALIWLENKAKLIYNPNGKTITDFKSWNARSIYFYDNNGNILELIARFDRNDICHKPFSATAIRCINEIGLVSDNAPDFSKKLIEDLSIHYFEKGPKKDDFVVLGDNQGLLIVSAPNRHWYPTGHKAAKYPVRVSLTINNQYKEIQLNINH